jgi:hypothetical protein
VVQIVPPYLNMVVARQGCSRDLQTPVHCWEQIAPTMVPNQHHRQVVLAVMKHLPMVLSMAQTRVDFPRNLELGQPEVHPRMAERFGRSRD